MDGLDMSIEQEEQLLTLLSGIGGTKLPGVPAFHTNPVKMQELLLPMQQ